MPCLLLLVCCLPSCPQLNPWDTESISLMCLLACCCLLELRRLGLGRTVRFIRLAEPGPSRPRLSSAPCAPRDALDGAPDGALLCSRTACGTVGLGTVATCDDATTKYGDQSISLLICVAVGFVTGVVGVLSTQNNHWPTEQMSSRGEYWGLLVGLIIAIPSGMAVALSILR